MSKNIEMNIKQDNGQYEIVYPKTNINNIIDINDNYFTKNQTLTSETAKNFGQVENNLPENIFYFLSKYNLHWWKRTKKVQKIGRQDIDTYYVILHVNRQISYSSNVYINDSNSLSLLNPYTIQIGNNNSGATALINLAPIYFYAPNSNQIFYLPENSTTGYENTNTIRQYSGSSGNDLRLSEEGNPVAQKPYIYYEISEPEYVFSFDKNSYPDFGEKNEYYYEYLGIPYENIIKSLKIETGTYKGTGSYGMSNPNNLTFNFIPKVVLIHQDKSNMYARFDNYSLTDAYSPCGYINSLNGTFKTSELYQAKILNNTLTWCYTGGVSQALNQLNFSGSTYYYLAIG